MIFSGGMMLGIGLLMMFFVFGLPLLLVIAVVAGLMGFWGHRTGPASVPPMSMTNAAPARYCSHCGQGLQADWTHCPQCGALVEAK